MEPERLSLIDTHCHLQFEQFDADRAQVIERARRSGIEAMVTIGTDLVESERAVRLARSEAGVYAGVGVHPQEAASFTPETLEAIRELARDSKVVAIGEIGLDYHRETAPPDAQRRAFIAQLGLAREMGLPIILHNRDAHDDVRQILRDFRPVRGVAHCFSGTADLARELMDLGMFISFACNVTFKNAGPLREAAAAVPLDRLVIETDSPFLTAQAHRGQRNEPSYLRFGAMEIAQIHATAVEALAHQTSENARALFGLEGQGRFS